MPLPYTTYQAQTEASQSQTPISNLLSQFARRGGPGGHKTAMGSALSGAMNGASYGSMVPVLGTLAGLGVGAAIGGIKGLVQRKAATAPTDFAVGDARDAIAQAYQRYLGRDPEDGAVETHIKNGGFDAPRGHRWVGEKGLEYILSAIQNSEEAKQYQQRQSAPQTTTLNPAAQGIAERLDTARSQFGSGQTLNRDALLRLLQGR